MHGEHIHVRTDERGVDHRERTEIVRGYVDRRRASGETRDGCEPARVDADRLDESRHGDRANRGIDCKWLNDNEQVGKVAAGRGDAMTARDERRSVERLFRLFLYFLLVLSSTARGTPRAVCCCRTIHEPVEENDVSRCACGRHDWRSEEDVRTHRVFGLPERDAADLHAAIVCCHKVEALQNGCPFDDALPNEFS